MLIRQLMGTEVYCGIAALVTVRVSPSGPVRERPSRGLPLFDSVLWSRETRRFGPTRALTRRSRSPGGCGSAAGPRHATDSLVRPLHETAAPLGLRGLGLPLGDLQAVDRRQPLALPQRAEGALQ